MKYYVIIFALMGGKIRLTKWVKDTKPVDYKADVREMKTYEYFVATRESINEIEIALKADLKQKNKWRRVIHLRTEELPLDENDSRVKELRAADFTNNQ